MISPSPPLPPLNSPLKFAQAPGKAPQKQGPYISRDEILKSRNVTEPERPDFEKRLRDHVLTIETRPGAFLFHPALGNHFPEQGRYRTGKDVISRALLKGDVVITPNAGEKADFKHLRLSLKRNALRQFSCRVALTHHDGSVEHYRKKARWHKLPDALRWLVMKVPEWVAGQNAPGPDWGDGVYETLRKLQQMNGSDIREYSKKMDAYEARVREVRKQG